MSRTTLPQLDSSLYPQQWQGQTFVNSHELLMAMLQGEVTPDAAVFTQYLMKNPSYQEWINFTVFGRYIQRSFSAFYAQTEDSFNTDMPALFRHELLRHAQYLPLGQMVFVAGVLTKKARQEKLITTTLNPATVINNLQSISQQTAEEIINQLCVTGTQVIGFPVRHNKRTSERTRNEMVILDFQTLVLIKEQSIKKSNTGQTRLLRYYELR